MSLLISSIRLNNQLNNRMKSKASLKNAVHVLKDEGKASEIQNIEITCPSELSKTQKAKMS